jgi:hypothetical protein
MNLPATSTPTYLLDRTTLEILQGFGSHSHSLDRFPTTKFSLFSKPSKILINTVEVPIKSLSYPRRSLQAAEYSVAEWEHHIAVLTLVFPFSTSRLCAQTNRLRIETPKTCAERLQPRLSLALVLPSGFVALFEQLVSSGAFPELVVPRLIICSTEKAYPSYCAEVLSIPCELILRP